MSWELISTQWPTFIFLGTLLVLGMPHGAIDHYLFFRSRRKPITPKGLTLFASSYILVAVAMAALWFIFPEGSVWGLVLLTWFHWGEGEIFYERHRGNQVSILFGVWRGALPMLIPLIANSDEYLMVLDYGVKVADRSANLPGRNLLSEPGFPWLLGCSLGLLAVTNWFVLARNKDSGVFFVRLILEDVFLVLFFLLLPPLASVGLYFAFWHSLRHIRLSAFIIGPPLKKKNEKLSWIEFYKLAAPFTISGILLMGLLAYLLLGVHGNLASLIGVYLIVLWSLTWPHAWIVRKTM